MMPGWSVQTLRDRERDLRALAERRRSRTKDEQTRPEPVPDALDLELIILAEEPCDGCLERAS